MNFEVVLLNSTVVLKDEMFQLQDTQTIWPENMDHKTFHSFFRWYNNIAGTGFISHLKLSQRSTV